MIRYSVHVQDFTKPGDPESIFEIEANSEVAALAHVAEIPTAQAREVASISRRGNFGFESRFLDRIEKSYWIEVGKP